MIKDPFLSIAHAVSTSGTATQFVTFDMVAQGPGSQTTRKAATPSLPGFTQVVSPKHEVTNQGRRRSTFRVDIKVPIGVSIAGYISSVPQSASAYIVLDRLNDDSASSATLIDTAVSILLNSLVSNKASSGDAFSPTEMLSDFMNGEP